MELATLKDVQTNTENESSSLSNHEESKDIETELDIKENTSINTNSEASQLNQDASPTVSSSSIEISSNPLSLDPTTNTSNEVIRPTTSTQRRNRRLIVRPIGELATIAEDAVIDLSSHRNSSISSLNRRARDDSDDSNSTEDNNLFDDSLDRHNAAFLIGIWNGPPEMNPSLILAVTLGVTFFILIAKYIQSLKPVYA